MTPLLQKLFLLAAAGVLLAVGLVVGSFGLVPLAAYVVLVAVLVGFGLRSARRVALATQAAGRTCTCCTSTVHDPVEVV